MKPNYRIVTAVVALIFTFSSCTKFDWDHWKDGKGKGPFGVGACDVQKITLPEEGGGTRVEMEKTYNSSGLVKTISFYTYSATTETFWRRFQLSYNEWEKTVMIKDLVSGENVLKAIFNNSGRLIRLKRLQGETSDYGDRTFEYAGGKLVKIYVTWKTFNSVESFTYDASGNIKTRSVSDGGSTVTEASEFFYGDPASDKKQFYIPNFNYLIVVDPSMALVEYLRWIKDFSPKNILTRIEYTNPLPHEDNFSAHVFDGDKKLINYTDGAYVGGTKTLIWRCSKDK